MSSALTGTALTSAKALARGFEDDHEALVYLGPERGDLDEAAVTLFWLPGGGWEEASDEVLLSEKISIEVDERGAKIGLTVAEASRLTWADDRAVAVIARHWFPGLGWGAWYLEAWGYITGEGQAKYDADLGRTLRLTATYAGYWERIRLPGHRMGRRNLAAGASIAAASPHLLTPAAEVGIEYLAQDDCAPGKLIDQLGDTVAVADAFADPTIPTIGETYVPKILRVGGPHVRGVAAGGQARFVEAWAGYDILRADTDNPASPQWGTFDSPGDVPAPEGNASPTISNDFLDATLTGGKYVIHAKRQATNQNNSVYVGWDIGSAPLWYGVPALLTFRVKAGATDSIGLHMQLQLGVQGTNTNHEIRLSGSWQKFEFPISGLGTTGITAGGLNVKFRAARDELFLQDIYFELDDFHLWVGYNGANYTKQEGRALFLGMDDGAGHERLLRLANINGGNEITIPPRSSIVIVDDASTFQQQYGDTGKTILQVKGDYPEWFFSPGVGRMKLCYGNDPQRLDYDDPSTVGPVVNSVHLPAEEILFSVANGGVSWLPTQTLSRQSPVGTGFLAVEDFGHLGLVPPFGAAYWWVDLGAFVAPKLTAQLPAGAGPGSLIRVENSDYYTERGIGKLDLEKIRWVGKEGDALIVANRGYAGTTAADHAAGAAFVPDSFDGANQGLGLSQTGHNVDQIEIRRKPGTPRILAGAVIASNLVAPGNPSEGGALWELHPDWFLIQRYSDRQGNPDVITMNLIDILGGPRELRHVCHIIDEQERYNGLPSRAKTNELVVREWQATSSAAGSWTGHGVADVNAAIAHVLVMHGEVPASKVTTVGRSPAIGDLTIAPSMVGAAIDAIGKNDGVHARVNRANAVSIEPVPTSPAYTATVPYWTWTSDLVAGPLAGSWAERRKVAQVRIAARDAATLRSYNNEYPSVPGPLGSILDLRDVRVLTAQDAFNRAMREWRAANTRRALSLPAGALPWIEVGQRHLLALDELDGDGGFDGINVTVGGYTITIGIDDGGVTWDTTVAIAEMALG